MLGFYINETDIHITRAIGGQPTEPKSYPLIFERGIDPDVDNPEQCHAHSELPNEWPPVEEILDFQENVRNRVRHILKQGAQENDRCLSEALWIGFEHEAMHLETFLYMLLQSDRILPPQGSTTPDFKLMASQAKMNTVPNEWFTVPRARVSIGLDDDASSNSVPKHSFGWDNEKPYREADVPAFSAHARPITNGEYAAYLEQNHISAVPSFWVSKSTAIEGSSEVVTNGSTQANGTNKLITASEEFLEGLSVRTVFGPVPLRFCLDWPVMASYDELAGYAKWMGCRIPSFEEARSLYKYSAELKSSRTKSLANGDRFVEYARIINLEIEYANLCYSHGLNGTKKKWNLQNGHVEDTINRSASTDHQPVKPPDQGHQQPVYIDLDGCNVGFKHWHPTPVTHMGNHLCGQGELGGVLEWTSSPLKEHDGFQAMDIYPGYTGNEKPMRHIVLFTCCNSICTNTEAADFFDGKHNIVLGGSWATHPRIAGRTTL